MATEIEAKIDADAETNARNEVRNQDRGKGRSCPSCRRSTSRRPPIRRPRPKYGGRRSCNRGRQASAAKLPPLRPAKPAKLALPEVEPQKPDFGDQTLRLAIEMAAARSADETRRKFFSMPVPAAAAAPRQSWRTPLAAAVVLAAVGGAAFGSLSGASLGYLWFGSSGSSRIDASALSTMKAELAELATLKASVDGATRGANGQFAKLADRLDRVEHAQAEPSAKLTHISEALDRLEKKSVAAAAPLGRAGDDWIDRRAASKRRCLQERQAAARLDRSGRAARACAGGEPFRRRVRRHGRQHVARPRSCSDHQTPRRPMGRAHR